MSIADVLKLTWLILQLLAVCASQAFEEIRWWIYVNRDLIFVYAQLFLLAVNLVATGVAFRSYWKLRGESKK